VATPERPVVLVAEDEWLLRDCIAAYLRAAHWRVLEARSGEAAVSLLEGGQHIDVVFTDIRLAGEMSGWEVGERFRRVLPDSLSSIRRAMPRPRDAR
jgi:CheY-like chemotaxis protein